MIDQLPTAVPQTAQSANTANRDRKQTAAEKDDQTGSFEDIISKAGQKKSREDDGKNAEVDLSTPAETESRGSADGRPKVTFEFSAALRGFGATAQGQTQGQAPGQAQAQVQANAQAQLKLTTKDIAKVARSVDQTGQQAEAALAKVVEKLKDAAQKVEKLADKIQLTSADASADVDQALTPSDELGLLLGLTKETDSKHGKKSADGDRVEKADDDEHDSRGDRLAASNDASRINHFAAAADAKVARDNHAADDKSSQNDVVRLVSANGRGRPVDIDVPTVPGETQRDAAKAATTAKVDTATVLEARRYLGFTPEPNATALTTAIKADPTWTAALQAAQTSDQSTLGNTVTEVNTLKLQMNPENLGNMVASLKIKGEELTVELRVDSVEAYQQLSADHDDIVKALQDQGFTIDKVTVQLNATDRTDTGADRDTARQGQAQRDGDTQQRDGQSDRRSGRNDGQREQPRWTPSGTAADGSAGDSRTDAGRAGNIYL